MDRGLTRRLSRGLYEITDAGREEVSPIAPLGMETNEVEGYQGTMDQALEAEQPAAVSEPRKRAKQPLHWAVKTLFDLATEKGIKNDQELEDLIIQKTGHRIPKNTLRYWKNGWSEPKISEVEFIAKALGQELELMDLPSET